MSRRFSPRQRRLLLMAVLLLLFAALKLAALWWWQQQPGTHAPATIPSAAPCDIRVACTLNNGAQVRFSRQQQVNAPFDIHISGLPQNTHSVYVQFSMSGMDMGFNRFELRRADDGSWQTRQIRLPLCIESRHDYLADIYIDGVPERIAFTAP
ncbi:hypothetical protein L1281_001327 [Neisseria sp. HSC-16F19]|nr:hypothetical protein [Neisseria sp. HSC-16F19]MCP2040738.1 hypothetical protein [Neisseria sp. HSC-16F19]